MVTIKFIIALVELKGWNLFQMDVYNTFLQGDLDEEVYMELFQGFKWQWKTKLYKLKKSLYELKQELKQYNVKLSKALVDAGYNQSKYDYLMFTKSKLGDIAILLVYMYDLLITGSGETLIK